MCLMVWVVLSDVLDETGDSAEGGEAPAADTDGVGPVTSSDSRVVESLEYVNLGHQAGVIGEQFGEINICRVPHSFLDFFFTRAERYQIDFGMLSHRFLMRTLSVGQSSISTRRNDSR